MVLLLLSWLCSFILSGYLTKTSISCKTSGFKNEGNFASEPPQHMNYFILSFFVFMHTQLVIHFCAWETTPWTLCNELINVTTKSTLSAIVIVDLVANHLYPNRTHVHVWNNTYMCGQRFLKSLLKLCYYILFCSLDCIFILCT